MTSCVDQFGRTTSIWIWVTIYILTDFNHKFGAGHYKAHGFNGGAESSPLSPKIWFLFSFQFLYRQKGKIIFTWFGASVSICVCVWVSLCAFGGLVCVCGNSVSLYVHAVMRSWVHVLWTYKVCIFRFCSFSRCIFISFRIRCIFIHWRMYKQEEV